MEVGARDVQGLPCLAQLAPRQSYVSMAGKPMPSSHEPPCQWNQAPVTLIYQWKNKGGRDGGKRMIQRLNEESGCQENAVLRTWQWCNQGLPCLSQTTDCWPHLHSSSLTVLNKFNFIKRFLRLHTQLWLDWRRESHLSRLYSCLAKRW